MACGGGSERPLTKHRGGGSGKCLGGGKVGRHAHTPNRLAKIATDGLGLAIINHPFTLATLRFKPPSLLCAAGNRKEKSSRRKSVRGPVETIEC